MFSHFAPGLGVVIALNSVTIGLETDSVAHAVATQEEHDDRLWYIVELIFCTWRETRNHWETRIVCGNICVDFLANWNLFRNGFVPKKRIQKLWKQGWTEKAPRNSSSFPTRVVLFQRLSPRYHFPVRVVAPFVFPSLALLHESRDPGLERGGFHHRQRLRGGHVDFDPLRRGRHCQGEGLRHLDRKYVEHRNRKFMKVEYVGLTSILIPTSCWKLGFGLEVVAMLRFVRMMRLARLLRLLKLFKDLHTEPCLWWNISPLHGHDVLYHTYITHIYIIDPPSAVKSFTFFRECHSPENRSCGWWSVACYNRSRLWVGFVWWRCSFAMPASGTETPGWQWWH